MTTKYRYENVRKAIWGPLGAAAGGALTEWLSEVVASTHALVTTLGVIVAGLVATWITPNEPTTDQ